MIKYVLIVLALTESGPVSRPVAEFQSLQHCMAVAEQIVPHLQVQLQAANVTAVCHKRTDV